MNRVHAQSPVSSGRAAGDSLEIKGSGKGVGGVGVGVRPSAANDLWESTALAKGEEDVSGGEAEAGGLTATSLDIERSRYEEAAFTASATTGDIDQQQVRDDRPAVFLYSSFRMIYAFYLPLLHDAEIQSFCIHFGAKTMVQPFRPPSLRLWPLFPSVFPTMLPFCHPYDERQARHIDFTSSLSLSLIIIIIIDLIRTANSFSIPPFVPAGLFFPPPRIFQRCQVLQDPPTVVDY